MGARGLLRSLDGGKLAFHCPGCGHAHTITPRDELSTLRKGPAWEFNGDYDRPTLKPSILVSYDRPSGRFVCHSFVTDGKIQFLDDCTHDFAGRTVEMERATG